MPTKPPYGYEVWDFYEGEGVSGDPEHQAWLWRAIGSAEPDDDEVQTRHEALVACWDHAEAQREIGRQQQRRRQREIIEHELEVCAAKAREEERARIIDLIEHPAGFINPGSPLDYARRELVAHIRRTAKDPRP